MRPRNRLIAAQIRLEECVRGAAQAIAMQQTLFWLVLAVVVLIPLSCKRPAKGVSSNRTQKVDEHRDDEREEPRWPCLFPFVVKGLCGFMDADGRTVVPPTYDAFGRFSEGLCAVAAGGGWGFIDSAGSVAVPLRNHWVGEFHEGVAAYCPSKADGYWLYGGPVGYLDGKGSAVIPPRFWRADPFSDGLAYVSWQDDKAPDSGGIGLGFGEGSDFAVVLGMQGFIDHTGRLVLREPDRCAICFVNGLAMARYPTRVLGPVEGTKVGFIDKTGRMAVAARFDNADDFSEGLAAVSVAGQWGYINIQGAMVIEPRFSDAGRFSMGLAVVRVGEKSGFINTSGELAIGARFDHALAFREGLAAVEVGDRWGYINLSGRFVIPAQYYDAYSFACGLGWVRFRERDGPGDWGHVDREGTVIWRPD